MSATLYEGNVSLVVKGESHYVDQIQQVVRLHGREIVAILVPEPDNQYDPNAVSVWISGLKVGHLSSDDAAKYQRSIARLMEEEGNPIAVAGQIFGGEPGKPSFGVWLYHDPADFGVRPPSVARGSHQDAGLNTGSSAASGTWLDHLPSDRLSAIAQLRKMLADESDLVERHYMYLELEQLLYKSRDVFESALAEFESTCLAHDSEMEAMIPPLRQALDGVPSLPTYKQAAIMKQKTHDFTGALWWAQRGLTLYGDNAIRSDYVDDLKKRVAKYVKKLEDPKYQNR